MTLSDLASLGSFISGVAVLTSLVFLYFQLRQVNDQVRRTDRNQQASIRQARSTRGVDIAMGAATVPSVCEALLKSNMGAEDITDVQLLQIYAYWRAAFYDWEDAFFQNKDGLLTDSGLQQLTNNVRSLLLTIGARAMWRTQREDFSLEFGQWVEKLISDAPIASGGLPVVWRNALATEKALLAR